MQKFLLLCFFSFIALSGKAEPNNSLSGVVTDVHTGLPLAGATIYFPDLKTGTATGTDGRYTLNHLPAATVVVQVSSSGYKTIVDEVDLKKVAVKNYQLEPTIAELNEVVISSPSLFAVRNRTPYAVSVLSSKQLQQSTYTNIIDAIATLPGISQVTTGPGISKPVIRGLGYNRVLVVNHGIRQESQQWGDEHGVEIDENEVNRIEIIKGPSSLAYGSDAMAGVINMLPQPTASEGKIKAGLTGNYQSNNALISGSANLAGNLNGLIWDMRYSSKLAHAYHNRYDGYVFNSGLRENAFNAKLGINRQWGYSHLVISSYHLMPGIVEGERDSITGNFVKPFAVTDSTVGIEPATDHDFKSYHPSVPYQQIHHNAFILDNNFIIGQGALKAILGWQQNRRKEYSDALDEKNYGLYLVLNTLTYDFRYHLRHKTIPEISFGVNGMVQHSQNRGNEFLIPDFNLFDFGMYSIAKKNWKKWEISGGLRYDTRRVDGNNLWVDQDGHVVHENTGWSILRFPSFHSSYQGVSASLGSSWQINHMMYMKLNVSKGFRAPNISEIASNGIHEGTVNYIIGVPDLKPESSLQFDYIFGLNSDHVTSEIDLFYNKIDHYIFLQKLLNQNGDDSLTQGYSTFRYASGNAYLYGAELSIDVHPHPLDWLHFENSFGFVNAIQRNQPDSSKYLPFTPAPRITSNIRIDLKKTGNLFSNVFIKAQAAGTFSKNNIYAAYGTETPTPGYLLIDLAAGADVQIHGKKLFNLVVSVNNLTDKAYQNSMSRLKYLDPNPVTGRRGVYNMGRNIGLKIHVPFEFNVRKKG